MLKRGLKRAYVNNIRKTKVIGSIEVIVKSLKDIPDHIIQYG